jgi:capsid protein
MSSQLGETEEGRRLLESINRSLYGDNDPTWLTFQSQSSWQDGYPYRTPTQHNQIRDQMRWYAHSHPFAAAAIEVRAAYVVGSGHQYRISARPGYTVDEQDRNRCMAELERWMDADRWMLRQREIQKREDRDGEAFLGLFEQDENVAVRFIDPEYVLGPTNARPQDAYGIRVNERDAETVEGYWIATPTQPGVIGTPELRPATSIQHRKCNVDRLAPRGLPVLWPVRESLRRSYQILRSMSTVAGIQASIAAVIKRTAGSSVTPWSMPGDPGTGQDAEGRTYQHYPPGSVLQMAPGEELDPMANSLNVANYVAAIQAELRAIAARLCLPEYMLSGDASNANYSSSLVAEGPAVKMFEWLQSGMIWYDVEILMRQLRLAERLGRLPRGITSAIKIDADGPNVQSRDRLAEAQADQILVGLGSRSRRTVAARHGDDWDSEREQIEAEGGPIGTGQPQDLIPSME